MLTLTGLARGFARLTTAPPGTYERRVADAMRAHPFLVAGTGREDTALMAAVPGLLTKGGAEGVHGAALATGQAIALKIDDGAARARVPVLLDVLRRLGVEAPGVSADPVQPPGVARPVQSVAPGAAAPPWNETDTTPPMPPGVAAVTVPLISSRAGLAGSMG